MKAEDTVMSDEELEENIRKDYKDFRVKDETGYIQDILIWTREAQAGTSLKAVIKEVVEWTDRALLVHPDNRKEFVKEWQAQKKEWGIA